MRLPRKNSLILLCAILGSTACLQDKAVRVSLEVPGPALVKPEEIESVLLTGFFPEKTVGDCDLNALLVRYFQDALRSLAKAPIESAPVVWDGPDSLNNRDFWKKAGAGRKRLLLAGKASLTQESFKALVGNESRDVDGPFRPTTPWSERKSFALKLDLAVIKAETGEPVFRNLYQETILFDNVKQTADFAVYDLLDKIRPKLFRSLFGSERALERYLLTK